jgi:caffeoyl-CoA O-methyltransferase
MVTERAQKLLQENALTYRKRVEDYIQANSTPLPPLLEELISTTHTEFGALAGMITGQEQGLLLQMLVASTSAKRILEIGMFTGFSALMMAEALPEHGELTTCDVDPKAIAVAKRFFERSPHGSKIRVREGPALETLQELQRPYDLVYIDADKENLIAYYEAALELLAPNGLIGVDNVLWAGGSTPLVQSDERGQAIDDFNRHVREDTRVVNVILPVRAGLMLVRRA